MSHKKLLKYCRENRFSADYRPKLFNRDARKWIDGAIMFLEDCSAFYIDGYIDSIQEEEIFASAKAMKEAGVFGAFMRENHWPKNETLGHRILSRCRDVIVIPTNRCMNLAATANVVLYDRLVKCGDWPVIDIDKKES